MQFINFNFINNMMLLLLLGVSYLKPLPELLLTELLTSTVYRSTRHVTTAYSCLMDCITLGMAREYVGMWVCEAWND
jgi:hypothetical protein